MRRWIAIAWHASFLVLAAALFVLFVLPRWFELTGAWPVGLGTPLRIVCGVLIGLSALPVVFTLLHTRKPEFGTPRLALTLRVVSIVLHVLAGVLITAAAVTEIWVGLDSAGQWLFGIYGAAAAMAVLGALAFYLAYLAELPPPPPKPLKPLKPKNASRRGRRTADATPNADDTQDTEETAETVEVEAPADVDADAPTKEAEVPVVATEATEATEITEITEAPEAVDTAETTEAATVEADTAEDIQDSPEDAEDSPDEPEGRLRNRRPGGKRTGRFGRKRGGVALDE